MKTVQVIAPSGRLWNVTFDGRDGGKPRGNAVGYVRPWVGGSADGRSDTFRCSSLAGVLELIACEIVDQEF
jgi:hypothetical protein